MSKKRRLIAPFAKVEETADGGREVWGFASLERVDKTGEIADYSGTVQAFEKWSNETLKRSGGKSMGNVRVMHQPVTGGKMIHWEPGETEVELEDGTTQTVKGVWTGTLIPAHKVDVIKDIDEGILNALSIGGDYAKRWWDEEAQAFRYIPELAEYSLVDNPAVPGADLEQVIVKAATGPWGKEERNLVKADQADDEKSENEKLHEEAEQRTKKYGITFKDGDGHLTPPKGYPEDPEDYADPVNFRYPIDASHVGAAVPYYNNPENREKGGYSEAEWEIIGKRIVDAANKHEGEGHELKDGKIERSEDATKARKARIAAIQKAAADGEDLSFEDIRCLISCAINDGNPFDWWLCVVETYDDYVIVEDWENSKFYRVEYTIKDGEVELGDTQEVRQTYVPAKEETQKMKDTPEATKATGSNDEKVTDQIGKLKDILAELRAAQSADEKESGKSKEDGVVDQKIAALEAVIADLEAAQQKDNDEEEKEEGAEKGAKPPVNKADDSNDDENDDEEDDDEEEDSESAEKALEAAAILKTVIGGLSKVGTSISAERQKHLRHAVDHIHKALGDEDKVEDKDHIDGGAANKSADPVDVEKAIRTALRKNAGAMDNSLARALENAGLAKASDVAAITEQLTKANEHIAELESQVKAIGEQPAPGGPMGMMFPGVGGAAPWQAMEEQAIHKVISETDDPMLKDRLGQHLAMNAAKALRRPTSGETRNTP